MARCTVVAVLAVPAALGCGRIGFDELSLSEPGVERGGRSVGGGAPGAGAAASGSSGSGGLVAGGDAGAAGAGGGTGASGGSGGRTGGGGAGAGAGAGAQGGAGGVGGGATASAGAGGNVAGARDAGGSVAVGDPLVVGCADGEREGFVTLGTHPDIAACSGGFSEPGVHGPTGPVCARGGGDDGANPTGTGCNVLDLCASGWHLCADASEVATKSPTGCAGSDSGAELAFFATAQSGIGQAKCGATGDDDLFGCGSLGGAPDAVSCSPLDRWSAGRCSGLGAPWSCGTQNASEALAVTKPDPAAGGVLCCRD